MPLFKRYSLNEKGKDFVVGDIHGCFSKLYEQLQVHGFNEETDRLFCVGDMVDRGPESEDCLLWLDRPWFFSVRGNHEQMAINFMAGHNSALHYAMNGGNWFIDLDKDEQERYTSVFEELPYMIEVETENGVAGICHAEVLGNDWELSKKLIIDRSGPVEGYRAARNHLLWERNKIMMRNEQHVRGIDRVYLGHTPVPEIVRLGNAHYIDGGPVFKDGQFFVVNLTQDMKEVYT